MWTFPLLLMNATTNIGVVGAGTMGRGIAQIAAAAGHHVTLVDQNQDALIQAVGSLEAVMKRLVEKGRMNSEEASGLLSRISTSQSIESLSDSGLVVEAIVENVDVKSKLFADLEKVVSDQTVLATNTSSLSVTGIAASLQNPKRVIGLHFFNPAPLLPLVEVVPALQTDSGLPEMMMVLMRNWGKKPALAKDTPGFIVNRVARPFLRGSHSNSRGRCGGCGHH